MLRAASALGVRRADPVRRSPAPSGASRQGRSIAGCTNAAQMPRCPQRLAVQRRRADVPAASDGDVSTSTSTRVRTEIPGNLIISDVIFETYQKKKGQDVIVVEVKAGSAAAQAGVRPGQRLAAIGDPMRAGVLWELNDRPSLRFVVDTLRMQRSKPVDMVFEDALSMAELAVVLRKRSPPEEVSVSSQDDNTAASMASTDPLDGSSGGGGLTIGERLARKYNEAQSDDVAVSDVQKRIARRASYMDEVSQRDDSKLGLLLVGAFLGPALIILGIAAGSGYLDTLYLKTLSGLG